MPFRSCGGSPKGEESPGEEALSYGFLFKGGRGEKDAPNSPISLLKKTKRKRRAKRLLLKGRGIAARRRRAFQRAWRALPTISVGTDLCACPLPQGRACPFGKPSVTAAPYRLLFQGRYRERSAPAAPSKKADPKPASGTLPSLYQGAGSVARTKPIKMRKQRKCFT